jgi:catechol-2,3-dioxygenase
VATLGFAHYNLRAPRALLDELRAFYCEVVGLYVGERPPFRNYGYWLYAGGRDVLHLTEASPDAQAPTEISTTFDHAAFTCSGRAEFEQRLTQRGVRYRAAEVPLTGMVQLFFHDPAGNGVELNFSAE